MPLTGTEPNIFKTNDVPENRFQDNAFSSVLKYIN